jgi:hypothetical protein
LGFLPQFVACGIELVYRQGSSAPFEIYFYDPASWQNMIGPVDLLEDFCPGRDGRGNYQRSLAWLYLLPDDFHHAAYAADLYGIDRDLAIDSRSWGQFERLPCWIYSSVTQNRLAAAGPDSPLIWDDVVYR